MGELSQSEGGESSFFLKRFKRGPKLRLSLLLNLLVKEAKAALFLYAGNFQSSRFGAAGRRSVVVRRAPPN